MKESSTYLATVEEGRIDEARKMLLRLGGKHIGPADAATQAAIEAIDDRGRLEETAERASDVSSWEDLLSAPSPRRPARSRRKKS